MERAQALKALPFLGVFAQRAWAAFFAISRRCSGLIFSIRALAAFFAPNRAKAAAWGFFLFMGEIVTCSYA